MAMKKAWTGESPTELLQACVTDVPAFSRSDDLKDILTMRQKLLGTTD